METAYHHQNGSKKPQNPEKAGFVKGLQGGIPIAVGYLPIAITFGLLAKSSGIPDYASILMSFMVFAGASQFVAVNLIAIGINPWEIVMTTFMLNLRHFLMSASLSQRIDPAVSRTHLSVLAFGLTDETFSVASLRKESVLSAGYIMGLNLLAFSSWVGGTWAGIFLATGLADALKASMGIALYAMFIALLVPAIRESKPALLAALLAISIHSILYWTPLGTHMSSGWKIILSTIVAALFASIFFPGEAKE